MQLTLKGLEELSTSDNLSQTTLALFLFLIPNWGKIYPDLVAPEQLLSDAGVKWLSDTDSPPFVHPSQQTPKLKGRRKRTAKGLTPSVRQDPLAPAERVCGMPLTPRGMRAATRFQCGADSPRGPLLRGHPRQPPPAPKRARTRRPQAWASRTPAPRARPQTPPPPQRGRSDLPARVPVRPVIHVCNTHPTREREGGGQQSPTRRGPGSFTLGPRGERTGPGTPPARCQPGGRGTGGGEATPRAGGRWAAAGGQARARRGRRVPKRSAALGRDPHPSPGTVPLLTRREAAGSARAVSAAGLRGQEAPPHRGREGRWAEGRPIPHVRSPPPSPPAPPAAETCAEPGPRRPGGRAGG